MTNVNALWDFDDPAGSEQRLREAADVAEGTERLVLLTQVARALGLQERYDDGHALLDHLAVGDHEVAARVSLERGRLLRSSGDPDAARPHFDAAAAHEGNDALRIDAMHMQALVAPLEQRVAINEQALEVALGSDQPEARDWDASLLNNIGMAHADAGDLEAALATFERALAARERIGDDARTRVARWMVGWALRRLGRTAEALAVQRALKGELDAIGATDPYVDEELAALGG
ncbi:tetratricopeptide repeat protein [Nocardioides caricicola]|uniref:Tetratricopeptide repeat protein n=1 Tax=Nocardioides caricicola TaxID=634770 RepID=A0ABW0MVG8_9ACTN